MVEFSGSYFGRRGSASSTPSGLSSTSDSDEDCCCFVTSSPCNESPVSFVAALFFLFVLLAAWESAYLAFDLAKLISSLYLTKEWKE
jgi:hypothetical protein